MQSVFVWIIVLSFIYLISGIFLVLRSHTAIIAARSQILLYVFLIGNVCESLSTLVLMYAEDLNITGNHNNGLWFITCIIIISHMLVYLPYALRSYRMYLIFGLEENFDNPMNWVFYNRTTQKWLLKALAVIVAPISMALLIITVLVISESIKIYYNTDSNSVDNNFFQGTIIFVRFAEQLILIFFNYCNRNIPDDFNMTYELTAATIIYFITPLLSIAVELHRLFYWMNITRNLLLLIVTVIKPIIMSYVNSMYYQLLTADMLTSLDLVLLHPNSLQLFEDFLKGCDVLSIQEYRTSGVNYLELILYVECWIENQSLELQKKIYKYIDLCNLPNNSDGLDTEEYFPAMKNRALEYLRDYYFTKFANSRYMIKLQKEAFRHELYQIKLNNSSLLRQGSKINFVNHDWPLDLKD
ncbi:hypothetical protein SteCoe_8392 [Stentor coeruleus]|uniref:RGS domain-containing protein n=1 Tax=Stentor coeruleus TaxID=5963 RepID=A0A1R2CKD5_9CILI|nr:hypothetical protein SteCoe_8392 [Stentor coeruleus]